MIDLNRIKELRKEKGLTQKEVANAVHVSFRAYQNYENGLRQFPADILEHLSELYSVPIDYLLGKQSLDSEGYLLTLSGKSLNELTDDQKAAVKNVIDTFLKQNKKTDYH